MSDKEREHIAMIRENEDGTTTPLTLPNKKKLRHQLSEAFVLRVIFPDKIFCHFITNNNEVVLINENVGFRASTQPIGDRTIFGVQDL